MDGWVDGWNADWLVYGMICLKVLSKQEDIPEAPATPFSFGTEWSSCGMREVLQVDLCRRIGVSWTRTYWQGGACARILTAGRKPGS